MFKDNAKILKRIYSIAFIIIIAVLILSSIVNIAYASPWQKEVDVTIVIDKDGMHTTKGNLFAEDLWYPGKTDVGVIRVVNNSNRKIQIHDVGLIVELKKTAEEYSKDTVYNSFIDNMKLTIKKGNLLVFKETILDNLAISNILYKQNDRANAGFKLKESDKFNLMKDGTIDLEYTLAMDDKSGEELENLVADLIFIINVDEEHDNGNHNGWDNNKQSD
jgi:hypothetical protein